MELTAKALAIDPKNVKALLLRGTFEMQNNDPIAAKKSFTQAKAADVPATQFTEIADNALKDIAIGTSSGGTSTAPITSTTTTASGMPPAAPSVSMASTPLATMSLTLSPEAAKSVSTNANAAIFVIARSKDVAQGPPLAVKKITLTDINAAINFSASDAMMGQTALASGQEITLEARLSQSGQPMAAKGDWKSERRTVKLPVEKLILNINSLIEGK